MAAYAAVVSLMNVIYNIQNHPQFSISLFDKKQAESLGEKLDFLLDFIESNHSHEMLESEIATAAYAAEDVIESHIVDQIHSGSISSFDLQTVIQDMDSIKEKVVNFKEGEGGLSKVHRQYSMPATSSTPPITGGGKSTKMVGFEEELIQLLDALIGRQSSLQIIPIVGMGGIGFGGVFAPPEIWAMPQLRHLEFSTWIYLPDPSLRREEKDDVIVLKNLHTLKRVLNLKLTDEVCKRIPNVKKLKIMYFGLSKSSRYNHLYNIGKLHKLESLRVYFCGDFSVFQVLKQILKNIVCSPLRPRDNLLKNLKFPTSLKKLTLSGSNLDWEELKGIGSLPNLEVLKLEYHSVRGSKWNPIEGQFLRLKYLRIAHSRLKYWNAESFHFPALENLVLQKLHKLAEIPSGIGEIPTLGLIHLYDCSESAAISAMGILEEQQSQGNEDLRVRIIFWHEYQLEWFMEKVDSLECFNSNNLQLSHLD